MVNDRCDFLRIRATQEVGAPKQISPGATYETVTPLIVPLTDWPLLVLRLCCSVASVWFCSDIPGHWLAFGPWDQCAAIWAFPSLQNKIRRFLYCRNLRSFHSSLHNIVHRAVSLLPRRDFTAWECPLKFYTFHGNHEPHTCTCRKPVDARGLYRVAQKSKPLPNYQKIVLNRNKVCQWD